MSQYEPEDLEPAERSVHRLLAAVPPRPVPLGFRDAVMRRVNTRSASPWEWLVAIVLALPSAAFLAFEVVTRGGELTAALNNVVSAATADTAEAFFFVDGTTVLALAVLGIASLIAAHASMAAPAPKRGGAR